MSSYTHTTFGEMKARLAELLGDPQKIFYVDIELGRYIIEALRWWGLVAQYFRESARLTTVAGQAFYDVTTDVYDATGTSLLQSLTVTDRELINDLNYNLMEPRITDWTLGWPGSEQFSLDEIARVVEENRDSLLKQSGCLLYGEDYVVAGAQQRVFLNERVIQVMRAAIEEDGGAGPLPMWAADLAQMQATAFAGWPEVGRPKSYVTSYTPILATDIYPPARTQATMRCDVVRAGVGLDPGVAASTLGFPDDASWIVKYAAMDDLVGGDGLGRAPALSQYAEQRWTEALRDLAGYQSVVWASVGGRRVTVSSLAQLDAQRPAWQQSEGAPRSLHLLNWNRVAVNPVPDGEYVIELEVVRKAPIPTSDDDYVQVGREQLDALLDYAQHVAMIKCQGQEFRESFALYEAAAQQAQDWLGRMASQSVNWAWQQALTGQDRVAQRPLRRSELAQEAQEVARVGSN